MQITTSIRLPAVRIITPAIHSDFRGEFVQTYRRDQYSFTDEAGLHPFTREPDALERAPLVAHLSHDAGRLRRGV